MAREIKAGGLFASTQVIVNLKNENDNVPIFQKLTSNLIDNSHLGHVVIGHNGRKTMQMGLKRQRKELDQSYQYYEASVYENARPGTLVLQVSLCILDNLGDLFVSLT